MKNEILHYGTVTVLLKNTLHFLMNEGLFKPFVLVGGTNLSLRFGHRLSADIDLFSDAVYGSLDFQAFESFLRNHFTYCDRPDRTDIVSFGRSFYVGESAQNCIKLDLMYTDPFIREPDIMDGIRLASVDDIVAMKMDAISRGGRKKDFWDIHKLLENYTFPQMLQLHEQRYPWVHDESAMLDSMIDFTEAEDWPDPICIESAEWDEIKLDLIDVVESYRESLCGR